MSNVIVADSNIATFDESCFATLMDMARQSPQRRSRICLHRSPTDAVHEMLLCLCRDSYIRAHRHPDKTESFHLIRGQLTVVLFNDSGEATDRISMGLPGSGRPFLYRLSSPIWHTVIPETDFVFFHETTNGPFVPGTTEFAPWSPESTDTGGGAWIEHLRRGE